MHLMENGIPAVGTDLDIGSRNLLVVDTVGIVGTDTAAEGTVDIATVVAIAVF